MVTCPIRPHLWNFTLPDKVTFYFGFTDAYDRKSPLVRIQGIIKIQRLMEDALTRVTLPFFGVFVPFTCRIRSEGRPYALVNILCKT
ncbi:hypothetical protein TNCV_2739911 [Trichonephila clavipes]|nr:hypothetical protein TNCV_2739911 [Trichonephila clavipes]